MTESMSAPVFASGGDDIKLWDASSLEIVKQYNFHKGNIKDLCWSHDNTCLSSTAASGDKIILCESQLAISGKPKIILECAAGEHQTCVQLALSGRKIYSGGVAGDVNIWDQASGKLKKSYKDSHSSPITCIALNDLETYVATGTNKGDVIIRNLNSDAVLRPETGVQGQAVRSMVFSPWKHSLLGMTLDDGSLCLWDSLQSTPYHNFAEVHKAPAMSLAFSPFNDLLFASVGLDKYLVVYDVKGRKILNKTAVDQPLTSVTFMHDGISLFAGSSLGRIYQFDLRSIKRAVKDVPGHSTSVQRIVAHNMIKVKKERRKKSEMRGSSSQQLGTEDRSAKHLGRTPVDDNKQARGDADKNITFTVQQPRSENGSAGGEFFFTNGRREANPATAASKSYNSTPTARVQPSQVDDLGGILSPVQGDPTFNSYSLGSHDGSIAGLSQLPALAGNTFSSSRDTIGSYTDDVLSPIADPGKPPKPRTPHTGVQIHSRISPHPLRLPNNAMKDAAAKDTKAKAMEDVTTEPQVTANRNNVTPRTAGATSRSADKPASAPNTVAISLNVPPHRSSVPTSSTPAPHQSGSVQVQGSPSHAVASSDGGEISPFQYQAEYLRNTVKELVDEMGDNIREHTNQMLTQIVKLFICQEDLIRELLLERRCGINEQLLQEIERLREENERLRRNF